MNAKTNRWLQWGGLWMIFLCLLSPRLSAQDEPDKFTIGGYTKFLQSQYFAYQPVLDSTIGLTDNLFHNRLNLRYYPNKKWTIGLEARNRLFYGDQLQLNPLFADQVDTYNGLVDLSVRWFEGNGFMLHSIIDRAFVQYSKGKWDITLGRQRINWGMNLVWNPNDLFNAYNFLDFDYEERPGSDALRIQYYTGVVSRVELAFAPDDTLENSVGALLYQFNTKGYDIQLIGGYYRGDLTFGTGWAGNLGTLGFKGEASFFTPLAALSEDSVNSFNIALTLDYMFGNGFYLSGSGLYNNRGVSSTTAQNGLIGGALSPKNLFPARIAAFIQGSGNITPILSANASLIYGPENQLLIFVPGLSYSIKENWNLDLIGQSFFMETGDQLGHQATGIFLRMKWSY